MAARAHEKGRFNFTRAEQQHRNPLEALELIDDLAEPSDRLPQALVINRKIG